MSALEEDEEKKTKMKKAEEWTYQQEDLIKAAECVASKELTPLKAANKYLVPYTALCEYLDIGLPADYPIRLKPQPTVAELLAKKRAMAGETSGENGALAESKVNHNECSDEISLSTRSTKEITVKLQLIILKHLQGLKEKGRCCSLNEAAKEVKLILDKMGEKTKYIDNLPDDIWMQNFFERNPEILEMLRSGDIEDSGDETEPMSEEEEVGQDHNYEEEKYLEAADKGEKKDKMEDEDSQSENKLEHLEEKQNKRHDTKKSSESKKIEREDISYKVGWPYLENIPVCIIHEEKGCVYTNKTPLSKGLDQLNSLDHKYIPVRNVLSLFPPQLREEVTEVINDLQDTFHAKVYKDDRNKKYLHLKSFLALALVHPYCAAFQNLQNKLLDILCNSCDNREKGGFQETVDTSVQTDYLPELFANNRHDESRKNVKKYVKEHEKGIEVNNSKDVIDLASDSDDDIPQTNKGCVAIDCKTKTGRYVPERALIPDAVQVDLPLVYNPTTKVPVVYGPKASSERTVTRLASLDPATMKVVVSDEYVLEEACKPVINKDGLPNLYVPGENGRYKIVRPQILTLTIPELQEQTKKVTSSQQSLPKANNGIPAPPPLKDTRGQVVPNPYLATTSHGPEPGELLHSMPPQQPPPFPNYQSPMMPSSVGGPMMPTMDPSVLPFPPYIGMPPGARLPHPSVPIQQVYLPVSMPAAGNNPNMPGQMPFPLAPGTRIQVPVVQNMPMSLVTKSRQTSDPKIKTTSGNMDIIPKAVGSDSAHSSKAGTPEPEENKAKKRKRKSVPIKIINRSVVTEIKEGNKSADKKGKEEEITEKDKEQKEKEDTQEDAEDNENTEKELTRKSPRQLQKHPAFKLGIRHPKLPAVKGFKQKGQNLAQLVKKIKKVNTKRLQTGTKFKPLQKLKSPKKKKKEDKKEKNFSPEKVENVSEERQDENGLEEPAELPGDLKAEIDCLSNSSVPATNSNNPVPSYKIVVPSVIHLPSPSQTAAKKKKQLIVPNLIRTADMKACMMTDSSIRCCPHSGCNQHFDTMEHADLHASTHSEGISQLKCPECDLTFTTLRWYCLLKHLKDTHNKEYKDGDFACYLCGLKFEDQEKLDNHFTCHYCNRYKCVYCGSKIFIWTAMETHLKECNVKKEGKHCNYGCPFCHVVFRESHFYKAHIKSHHDDKFKCIYCESSKDLYDNWQKLRAHYISKHKTLETVIPTSPKHGYSCQKCGKQYVHYNKLLDHMNSVHSDPQYQCSKCEKMFRTKQSRTWHEEFAHAEDLKCPECDFMGKTKVLLKLHQKQMHGDKRLLCHECGKSFAYYHQLKVHTARHARQKKHTCKICSEPQESYLELRQHMIKQHPSAGNKPLQSCSFCSFQCFSRTTLKMHVKKIHPEEAPPEEDHSEHSYFNKKEEPPALKKKPSIKRPVVKRPSFAELREARTAKFKEQMAHLRSLRKEKLIRKENSCARTRTIDEWKQFLKKVRRKKKKLMKKQMLEQKLAARAQAEEKPMRRERKAKRKAVQFIEEVNAVVTGKVTLGDYERPKWVSKRPRRRSEEPEPSGTRRSARVKAQEEHEHDEEIQDEKPEKVEHPTGSDEEPNVLDDTDWVPGDDEPKKKKTTNTLRELAENLKTFLEPEQTSKKAAVSEPSTVLKPQPLPKPKKERKPRVPKEPKETKPKRTYKRRKSYPPLENTLILSPENVSVLLLDHNYCKLPETPRMTIVEAPDVSEFAECVTSPEEKFYKGVGSHEGSPIKVPRSLERSPRHGQTSPFRSTLRNMLRHSLSQHAQGQGFTRVSPGSSDKFTTVRIKSGTVQHIESEVDKLLNFVQSEMPNLENIEAIDKSLTETFGEHSGTHEAEAQLPDSLLPPDIPTDDLDDIVLNEADFKLLEKFNFDQGVPMPDIVEDKQGMLQPSASGSMSQGSISPGQTTKSIMEFLKSTMQKMQSSGGSSETLIQPDSEQAKSTVPDIVLKVPTSTAPNQNMSTSGEKFTSSDKESATKTISEVEEVASTLLSLSSDVQCSAWSEGLQQKRSDLAKSDSKGNAETLGKASTGKNSTVSLRESCTLSSALSNTFPKPGTGLTSILKSSIGKKREMPSEADLHIGGMGPVTESINSLFSSPKSEDEDSQIKITSNEVDSLCEQTQPSTILSSQEEAEIIAVEEAASTEEFVIAAPTPVGEGTAVIEATIDLDEDPPVDNTGSQLVAGDKDDSNNTNSASEIQMDTEDHGSDTPREYTTAAALGDHMYF